MAIDIALIGLGKISQDQHVPTIASDPRLRLVGGVSPRSRIEGIPVYPTLDALLAECRCDAVAINTPPQLRAGLARRALMAGKHVLLEKPPATTLSEVLMLADLAEEMGVTLYASWHSQHAPGIAPARDWLAGQQISSVAIRWKEDVRKWHPGQSWIWQAGGLGVFDPGINALSILTRILPAACCLSRGVFQVPANCQTPIAARLEGYVGGGGQLTAEFDFRQTGDEIWEIRVEADEGLLVLANGGACLEINGVAEDLGESGEYASLYNEFVQLIGRCSSNIDLAPLMLVSDAYLVARREAADPFVE